MPLDSLIAARAFPAAAGSGFTSVGFAGYGSLSAAASAASSSIARSIGTRTTPFARSMYS